MAQPIWNTTSGSLGTFPALVAITPPIQLSASSGTLDPVVTYKLLSGNLPKGVSINATGAISGTPGIVYEATTYTFVVRATNAEGSIRDRSFFINVSGYAGPKFTISSGSVLETIDSVWVEKYVPYTNPYPNNPIKITLVQGALPPGLELSETGLIRGYPQIPTIDVSMKKVLTTGIATTAIENTITCSSTIDFLPLRPVTFSGEVFGGIAAKKTYYIREILSSTKFTISQTQFGPEIYLNDATGFMNITLPDTVLGQPTARTYNFDLLLDSPIGSDLKSYSITVINQNLPFTKGGPGYPYLTRLPVILNTRPRSFVIPTTDPYYSYYLFPTENGNDTYKPSQMALMGDYESNNTLAFKVIGHTFDYYNLKYQFVGLPAGIVGDENTGWIYGTPVLNSEGIGQYSFTVRAYKSTDPAIQSGLFYFSLNIYKNITSTVVWISPSSLGSMLNSTVSTKKVAATADVPLEYRVTSGSLPPNLTLDLSGEITGYVSHQPTSDVLPVGAESEFKFSVQAYSPEYPLIQSTREFSITVVQEYDTPMDTLYMKATPNVEDRLLIDSLLKNEQIIPEEYVYRPDDEYFGKAKNVVYEHQYGVTASNIDQYLAAVQQSHYWKSITLGSLETAIARDENNNIIYEVVYSKIVDNLVNPEGESINFDIVWPEPINLNLGPWLTSMTNLHASYISISDQSYYTSLTPGYAYALYPNSLANMNKQIVDTLGQQFDSRILPLWMTSQQENGNTLGFVRAWVICYTKPGFAKTVKNNIETKWVDRYGDVNKLNQINFNIDRFSVNKSLTYNYDNYFSPPAWTGLPSGTPTPKPLNSKDFYVLFPRKTILPNRTQL